MTTVNEKLAWEHARVHGHMERAHAVARRSTCPVANVGAVLVPQGDMHRFNGWNGAQEGPSCVEAGCIAVPAKDGKREYSRHLHAEMDVLLTCARYGVRTEGAELFVTKLPCYDCMKFIIHAGVKTVWFTPHIGDSGYRGSPVFDLAETCGVSIFGV